MSILSELNQILQPLGIPVETGVFSEEAPDSYVVFVPLVDTYDLFADNQPGVDVPEVRISLYSKKNYLSDKQAIERALLRADFTITLRQYFGFEPDTKYHHYNIDVAKFYEMEEN